MTGFLPASIRARVHQRIRRLTRPAWMAHGRTAPLSEHWGWDRGTPVDRYYIEAFLAAHRRDIRGHGLEVKDSRYLEKFGSGLTRVDVLDIDGENPHATILADLSTAEAVAPNQFDCIVLTQTLQFVFDLRGAVDHLYRMLRPGGVLLATAPSIFRMDRALFDRDYWRLTVASCERLFSCRFGEAAVTVRSYGNLRTATAFLIGIAREELPARVLATHDDLFPVIIAVRAVKQIGACARGRGAG